MNNGLPSGWMSAKLGDCCEIVSGGTPKREQPEFWGGEVPWVTPKDISDLDDPIFTDPPESITHLGLQRSSAVLLPPGAVLFSSRAPIGLVAIAGTPMATNQGFKSLIPGPELDGKFLYYAIKRMVPSIAAKGNGATFKEVSKSVMSDIEIAFPKELTRQKKIAALLDRADAIRRKHRRVITWSNDLLRSLFIDIFGDPSSNPKGWPIGTIRDLVAEVKYGTSKKADVSQGEYPILRMGNITYDGDWDLSDIKYVGLNENEVSKHTVRADDILFNRTNSKELVGKAAVFDLAEPYAFAGYLVRARVNDSADPYYIVGYLNSAHGKATLRAMCKSIIGMANINAQEFQEIAIALPPLKVQQRYRALVDRIKTGRRAAVEAGQHSEKLFESLSQRAFRGERLCD